MNRTLPLREFVSRMNERAEAVAAPWPNYNLHPKQSDIDLIAFDTVEFFERAGLATETRPSLPHFAHWEMTVPYFTWGPAGLGLPLHSHAANYAATLFGSKVCRTSDCPSTAPNGLTLRSDVVPLPARDAAGRRAQLQHCLRPAGACCRKRTGRGLGPDGSRQLAQHAQRRPARAHAAHTGGR